MEDISRRKFLELGVVGIVGSLVPDFGFCEEWDAKSLSLSTYDVSKKIKNNLDSYISGCEVLTWGDVTSDGIREGIYIPSVKLFPNIIETATTFEDFVFGTLDRYGVGLEKFEVVSYYRPMERDLKLSPKTKIRAHTKGQGIDFKVKGVSSRDLYGILGSWEGGLGRYSGKDIVHWDNATSYRRRWEKKS